ncbi:hypothetical protein [Endozoicomonas acroporae]|uniref:hypothetical protein n=1 Tax=Endozoicomonas acroporae TaxID=1701104 RepID=UPI003D7C0DED
MWSNGGVYSLRQGFILKTILPTYYHAQSAVRVDQRAGFSGIPEHPGNTFNGKRVANYQPHRMAAATPDYGKCTEDDFWWKKRLYGHRITPAGVLAAYGNDRSSLRSGFFLLKLCLQNILYDNKKVTPDQVIQEFNRKPDQNNKYQIAIARFKSECCLKGLVLNGQPVTPDAVVKGYQDVKATLELARFKSECCLKGLLLADQPVTPAEVVNDFPDSPQGKLGRARFKSECCLKGLMLNGQPVSPDAVVKDFPDSPEGKLGIARFKEECCMRGLALNGQPVSPDAVVKDFPDNPKGRLGIARFKAECCLKRLPLNGRQITPEAVVKGYQAVGARLELARFKAECCLRDLPLNGLRVTPEEVVEDYPGSPEGKRGVAHFQEECCLRGLPLNGQQVSPDTVVNGYRANKSVLGLAHFMEQCWLRGLALNGQPVRPDAVFKSFPDNDTGGKLGRARFKELCCLKGTVLNGRQVTPDEVIEDYQSVNAILELARFKAECCLRNLIVKGQQVTPDTVVRDYKAARATLELGRFKAECCLRGLRLNGQQVTPDAVVKDYERGGWLLERAIFYSRLALNARELNGSYLDNLKVLEAFNEAPGNHAARQIEYLMHRLQQPQRYDESNDAQDVIQKAWQLLDSILIKDKQQRLRCILIFMAMQNELTIDHQRLSAEQVLHSIQTLRPSFQNSRIYFFFLKHCYITGQPVYGRIIQRHQVLECLKGFPEGSKLRHALGRGLEQCLRETGTVNKFLFNPENAVACACDSWYRYAASASHHAASVAVRIEYPVSYRPELNRQTTDNFRSGFLPGHGNRYSTNCVNNAGYGYGGQLPDVIPILEYPGRREKAVEGSVANSGREHPFPYQPREYWYETEKAENTFTTGRAGCPDHQVPQLNALTLRTLEIIQVINDAYPYPPILITGSYARYLQNRCSSFNDIDLICTAEEPARALFGQLRALNTDRDSEIPKSVIIGPVPGCPVIKLPKAFNIHLTDGDLGAKAMGLQVSVDDRVAHQNKARLAIHVPGVEKPVWCLSFAEETRLLNDTLKFLTENLDPLTEQLQKGAAFALPRTILFNTPQNTSDRIYGLLIRSLLTLNKARQFIALHSQGNPEKPYDRTYQLQEEPRRLYALTQNLHMKLLSHVWRKGFEHRVNGWLSAFQPVNDYQFKKKEFVKTLLALMQPE